MSLWRTTAGIDRVAILRPGPVWVSWPQISVCSGCSLAGLSTSAAPAPRCAASAIWVAPWNQRPPDAPGIPAGRGGSVSRHGVTGRETTNVLPLMVPRYQRDHSLPPTLTTVPDHRDTAGGVSKQPQRLEYRLYYFAITVKPGHLQPGPVQSRLTSANGELVEP